MPYRKPISENGDATFNLVDDTFLDLWIDSSAYTDESEMIENGGLDRVDRARC